MALTREDVQPHTDAMHAIEQALKPFQPEEQMVLVSGILGDILSKVGENPDRHSAVMLTGICMEMVFDMIGRNFDQR